MPVNPRDVMSALDDVVMLVRDALAYDHGVLKDIAVLEKAGTRTIEVREVLERLEAISAQIDGDVHSVMEEWVTDNLLVSIMQNLFRSYGHDAEERKELASNLRLMADHIEAGGPRPTNVLLGDPTGYKVP